MDNETVFLLQDLAKDSPGPDSAEKYHDCRFE